jgi:hypothetical protein
VHKRRFASALATVIAVLSIGLMPPGIAAAQDDGDTTTVTVNEFLPTDRDLSECISALPKPGCGSDARGGWRQTAVFGIVIAGLAFIGWRVVVGARRRPGEPATTDQP